MRQEEKELKEKLEKDPTAAGQGIEPLCQAEFESKLAAYESPFEDYNELMLQYGFVSLFSTAFPLCGVMALVNNIVEIRSDAYKLIVAHQRPIPRMAEDIGSWYNIMELMTYISVMTNCALVWFTSSFPEENNYSTTQKIWGFILSEHIIIVFKVFIAYIIPDVPEKTKEAMEREAYVNKKLAEEALEEQVKERNKQAGIGASWFNLSPRSSTLIKESDLYNDSDPKDVAFME